MILQLKKKSTKLCVTNDLKVRYFWLLQVYPSIRWPSTLTVTRQVATRCTSISSWMAAWISLIIGASRISELQPGMKGMPIGINSYFYYPRKHRYWYTVAMVLAFRALSVTFTHIMPHIDLYPDWPNIAFPQFFMVSINCIEAHRNVFRSSWTCTTSRCR